MQDVVFPAHAQARARHFREQDSSQQQEFYIMPHPCGWYAFVACVFLIAPKCFTDDHTFKLYKKVSTVMRYVKEIDQELRPYIFRPHLFIDMKYRTHVNHTNLGYLCTVDASSLHLLDNYICMMQAHDTIHQTVFVTLDSKADDYMYDNFPLLLRNFVDLEKRVKELPLEKPEKTLVRKQLEQIVILQTVSLFAKREFDMLITNPYTFWTRNVSTIAARLRPNIYVPYNQIEYMTFFGQMGNSEKPFPKNGNLMFGETFILMGKKETGRWIDRITDRIASTFSSLQGSMSHHCEDPRAKCALLGNGFFSTTDWFYGNRQVPPLIIEMDRPEYRTPLAIRKMGAHFLDAGGKCDIGKVWEFGSKLSSAPLIPSMYPYDRLTLVRSTHSRSRAHSMSYLRKRYAHHSLIDTLI